jgi:hypothetical protein
MITKTYLDPVTGKELDKRGANLKHAAFSMPDAVHFKDPERSYVTVEHILDEEIGALTLYVSIEWNKRQLASPHYLTVANRLSKCLFNLLEDKLPKELQFGSETLRSTFGVFISIPDLSSCPNLQTESLAELVLKESLKVFVRCPVCLIVVEGASGQCPECGVSLGEESITKKRRS